MAKFKYYALWLALICVVVFIVQYLNLGLTELFILNSQSFFQPWRFLTSIFLHGSIIHLVYNMFALILFGSILEKLIGSTRFLLVFFVSGILANLISINFYPSSLGASGSIYGIIGALTILRPLMIVWAFSLPMPMFLASIFWAGGDILGLFMPSDIGHIAHLSGIAFGIIFGIVLRIKKSSQDRHSYSRKIEIPEPSIRAWENSFVRYRELH